MEHSTPAAGPSAWRADAADRALVDRARLLLAIARAAVLFAKACMVAFVPLALGAVFLPCFVRYECRARQSEAKGNLKALLVAQRAHVDDVGAAGAAAAIGFVPKGARLRYDYEIVLDGARFRAYAIGRADAEMAGDVWRVDDGGGLVHVADGCR